MFYATLNVRSTCESSCLVFSKTCICFCINQIVQINIKSQSRKIDMFLR